MLTLFLTLLLSSFLQAQDWREGVRIPPGGRPNPYSLDPQELKRSTAQGFQHSFNYPVEDTGILLPYDSVQRFFEKDVNHPFKKFVLRLVGAVTPFKDFDNMEEWLGLVPYPKNQNAPHRMGLTVVQANNGAKSFTISCAQCHVSELFGRPVLGLTNRFPRANEFFERGLKALPSVSTNTFQWATESTPEETELFQNLKDVAPFIGTKKPIQLGLDTSLAQVAISLSLRSQDGVASKDPHIRPRPEKLKREVADSKPAVWWNVKYKNRWLSDGSVVSGNPIFTNIIWNEIGRGADLVEIEQWLSKNSSTVQELTTAVFNSSPPLWSDFLSVSIIDETTALKGEKIFNARCAGCHGVYEKAWSLPGAHKKPWKERMKTTVVRYHSQTPVIDVGTDPQRHLGMTSLVQLNNLDISKRNQIKIKTQKGYVPPPLVGIWARWPYFHNNSAPSLCAVLTAGIKRPKIYFSRAAVNPRRDFDSECNGYPLVTDGPLYSDFKYDTRRKGMSRMGHDEGIFLKNGQELLTADEKKALIRFLQTL